MKIFQKIIKFKPLTVELVNSNREIVGIIDFDINVVNQKCGNSLKRLYDYYFKFNTYNLC